MPANLSSVDDLYQALGPFVTSEAYQNFIDPALPNWVAAHYGENLPGLVQVKHDWDPDNPFTFAQAVLA